MFLDKHHPKLAYLAFTKKIVEHFVRWRTNYRGMYDRHTGIVHAETVNKEVGEARRCIMWARSEGIVATDSNAFHNVKVRKDGSNTKSVEPLTIDEQKTMLAWLRDNGTPWAHDSFLFLLITGMRVSDWEPLEAHSFDFSEDVIRIHQVNVARLKTGGKTSAAARVLPIIPTVRHLVERGHILERAKHTDRGSRFANYLKRERATNAPPFHVWPHRLRHTYATNNVCAYPGQEGYISVKLGHRSVQTTIDNYTHFQKLHNHDAMRKKFKDHLHWLENDYFASLVASDTTEQIATVAQRNSEPTRLAS